MTDTSPGSAGMTEADFAYLERLAASAAASGLYGSNDAQTKAQLLMKLIYGRDLGIPASAALSGIDIYDGKMELSSNLIAALLEAHPHYSYAIVESCDERCEIQFSKDGNPLGVVTFDKAAAQTAGLADTDYYKHYPSDMFFARAITRGARRHCPGLGRGVAIYAAGEIAKATPQPTASAAGPAPSGNETRATTEPRINDKDRVRIRALSGAARLSDAELFNVLVVAGGGEPVADEQRAASKLDKALEVLPLRLMAKVIGALTERKAALAGAAASNGHHDNSTVPVDFEALGPPADA